MQPPILDFTKKNGCSIIKTKQAMSKTVGKSSPQTGKWKSKEFRAFQGRKNHSAVDPAPEKVLNR